MTDRRVVILGLGAWGSALSISLLRAGRKVTAWTIEQDVAKEIREKNKNTRYLPNVTFPSGLAVMTELRKTPHDTGAVIYAIPTQHLRATAEKLGDAISESATLISVAKGLELETGLRPTQILEELFPDNPVAALLGPSHAEEVALAIPTSVAACSREDATAKQVQEIFHSESFRVYRNTDLIGAEMGSALKNVIALAAGISDGLGFGDNTKGALVTRGLAEISRLGESVGGRRETFYGLTGVGDLVTTSFSKHSRNRHVGEEIGRGKDPNTVISQMTQVAEGVPTSRSALALARKNNIEVPIIEQVVEVLFGNRSPKDALATLMSRDPRQE